MLQRDADVHVHCGSASTTSTRAGQHHIVLAKVPLKSKLSDFCFSNNMTASTCNNFFGVICSTTTSACSTPKNSAGGGRPTARHRSRSIFLAQLRRGSSDEAGPV